MSGIDQLRAAEPANPAVVLTPTERQDFWIDTCRECTQMHSPAARVLELYRQFGCRFATPSPQQVNDILMALDAAAPQWEQTHPELFYQTLELNYPELVRKP